MNSEWDAGVQYNLVSRFGSATDGVMSGEECGGGTMLSLACYS